MKLIVDTFEFGTEHVPQWNTISISGYHIREAGSTALQELAFTLYDGIEYIEWARRKDSMWTTSRPVCPSFSMRCNDPLRRGRKYKGRTQNLSTGS